VAPDGRSARRLYRLRRDRTSGRGRGPAGERSDDRARDRCCGHAARCPDGRARDLPRRLSPDEGEPAASVEAHHFCQQVNEDFAQCALYDGNTAEANLNGIEYIISERLFENLPADERQYWHPHNGEILSGQLVAPGLPEVAEHELMQTKINSYGKTWHTWNTGHGNEGGDAMPLGEPSLAWSFNRFGEAAPGLVESRDERMGISTEERRSQRQDLIEMAHPQEGVDALKDAFERPTEPIPGVVDKSAVPSQ
jgi:hypothetical protein